MPRLVVGKSKIFADSRAYWDMIPGSTHERFVLSGHLPGSTWGELGDYTSPHGCLIHHAFDDGYECDARSIQGFSCSKSADIPYENVDAFGAHFIAEQNQHDRSGKQALKHDEASLNELLSCNQIRILDGRGTDALSIRAWDGRLFIDNIGGSHHLAAAIHVAAKIGAGIPLTVRLHRYRFNTKTVHWLLESFHLVITPNATSTQLMWITKGLVGSASHMELPPALCNGSLLAFPKGAAIAQALMNEFLAEGYADFGVELHGALTSQDRLLKGPPSRWDTRIKNNSTLIQSEQ